MFVTFHLRDIRLEQQRANPYTSMYNDLRNPHSKNEFKFPLNKLLFSYFNILTSILLTHTAHLEIFDRVLDSV